MPKFGHIPLSLTLMHNIKFRNEKRYNLRNKGKESANKTNAQVIKEKNTAWVKVHSREERGLAAECKGNKNSLKKDGRRLFRVRFFSLQTYYLPSASCKVCLLCCYNTAAEAFPKLCHVVREGERKQTLFPLSKMAEGRGKAAMSREEELCSPSCLEEGWAIRWASLPHFPLVLFVLLAVLAGKWHTAVLSVRKKL